jgi:hypothetical protein
MLQDNCNINAAVFFTRVATRTLRRRLPVLTADAVTPLWLYDYVYLAFKAAA